MKQPEGWESLVNNRNAAFGLCDRSFCSLGCFRAKNQMNAFAVIMLHKTRLRFVNFNVLDHLRAGSEVATNDVSRRRSFMLFDIVILVVGARGPGKMNEQTRVSLLSRSPNSWLLKLPCTVKLQSGLPQYRRLPHPPPLQLHRLDRCR